MRRIHIAITGFGGIGRRIAQLMDERATHYRERHGCEVRIVGVCGSAAGLIDAQKLTPAQLADRSRFTPGLTGESFLAQAPAEVLFEASPTDFRTGGAALAYLRGALQRGWHAVAISKGALVVDYPGLKALADQHRTQLKVSGAAGSAMPLVDVVQHSLAGCRVESLAAIVTGTTNIILSEMMDRECSFDEALAKAQALGVAEADPTLDTHGWDTACKIAIVCQAALHTPVDVMSMRRQGIEGVTLDDVRRWRAERRMPRLVGRVARTAGGYEASVGVELFSAEHPFAQAHGAAKAAHIKTDLMGELTLVGGGSSPYGTAAAALKDFEHILERMK